MGSMEQALMVRFPARQQLRWFVESAPYKATLTGDARAPTAAVMTVTCELLQAERQQQRAPPLQVTDK
jgi:hypothetical protein